MIVVVSKLHVQVLNIITGNNEKALTEKWHISSASTLHYMNLLTY